MEPAGGAGALGLPARHRLPGAARRRHPRVRQARLRRRRALPRGRDRLAVGDLGAHARRAGGRRAATRRRRAGGRRPLDARGDRPHARLAADRAGLGSGGRGGDGRAAAARARGGGGGGRGRRRPGVDLQPGPGGRARSRSAPPSCPRSPTRPRGRRRCGARASASCPACGARRWSARARARARSRSTGGRWWERLPDQEGLWTAAGHGPWGISAGPATARIVAEALLGNADVPAPLSVARF